MRNCAFFMEETVIYWYFGGNDLPEGFFFRMMFV